MLACAERVINSSGQPLRVFVTDARLDRMPVYAAAVKARQSIGPTIWLVAGYPFVDRSFATLTGQTAPVTVLSRAGVDAVVLTPDWLEFGLDRVREMVSDVRYYSLSASLLDSTGQTIGYPFMVRKSGHSVVAVTGINIDSANVLTRLVGVRCAAPDLAAAKTVSLLRQRADLVGVMVEPRPSASTWGADFGINIGTGAFAMAPSTSIDRVNCYDVSAAGDRLTAHSVSLVQLEPDTLVVRALDSARRAAESLAAFPLPISAVPRTSAILQDELVRGMLVQNLADGFLCDSFFAPEFREPRDVGTLVSILRDPGRLAILQVRGDSLRHWQGELVLKPELANASPLRGQYYRVATTVEYLQRHPRIAASGFRLSVRPLWTICRDILESGAAK